LFSLVAEQPTTYRVEVRGPDSGTWNGKYAIVLTEARPATEADRAHVEGEKLFESAMGDLYKQTKEARTSAVEKYQKSIAFWQAAKDKSAEARAYYLMAYTYNVLGEYPKAEETATRGLPIAKASGDASVEAYLLDTIGTSYNERGQKKKSLEFFEQALPLRKPTDRVGLANTLNNIGMAYGWLIEMDKALETSHHLRYSLLSIQLPESIQHRARVWESRRQNQT
jgi:tetratricopeptide (TPR) repeat protein